MELACLLWPKYEQDDLSKILRDILVSEKEDGVIVRTEEKLPVAFMNISLRYDYVPGATKSPTAYLEGIYVREEFRKRGIAKGLIEFAEKWANQRGCNQLASDALLENIESQEFHKKVGFSEVERTVAFIKAANRDL